MALAFNTQKGKAQKSVNQFALKDGDNKFRIVGGILPRYVYWVPGPGGKNLPFEALGFDRDKESFTNVERDFVQEVYPDLKCGWAYACQVIDLEDGKLKVLNLKKKMWEQICTAAEDLGDPTDIETGWDVHVKRAKNGPHAYNVEYTLQVLRCKPRPLTAAEREVIADMKSIDELMPRPTAAKQKEQLDRLQGAAQEDGPVDEDISSEFDVA